MDAFVWTKMGVESGEDLAKIIRRKESERIAGRGIFWWGIGNSLGAAVRIKDNDRVGQRRSAAKKCKGRNRGHNRRHYRRCCP